MIRLANEEILNQTELVEEAYASSASSPLYLDKFLTKTFKKLYPTDSGPLRIGIPKSLDRLLQGDSEPAKIIELPQGLTYKGEFPIWRGDSTRGIYLRGCGYKNGDSRYPSTVRLGDEDVHAIQAGATGQGKSVALNAIISAVSMEYAPWEVKLTLVDAKIVEFKRYAFGGVLPHISAIAATTDADYIISVLKDLRDEMVRVNSMFTVYGVQNIIDFRKKMSELHGVHYAFPRNLITVDEFQTMFKNAERKSKVIENLIDDYARLGRSTGYHLLMASQEPGDIPRNALANIKVRLALGCVPKVSEAILGNDEAKMYYGIKGRVIVNTKASEGNKADNEHYRVPFQPSSMFESMNTELARVGDEVEFRHKLSFYDEAAVRDFPQYSKLIESKGGNTDKIYLGEPSFVMRDPNDDNFIRMEFKGKDTENVLIFCPSPANIGRYTRMIKENVKAMGDKARSVVFTADRDFTRECGLDELLVGGKVFDLRDSEDHTFWVYVHNIYRRLLCLDADSRVFENRYKDENSDAIFDSLFSEDTYPRELVPSPLTPEFRTELNRYRTYAIMSLLHTEAFISAFGHSSLSKEARHGMQVKLVWECLKQYMSSGCSEQKLTTESLIPMFYWVVSAEKIIGWGRDSKTSKVARLKKLLQDCTPANVRFIITTTTMEDLGDLKSGIRYSIMDGVTEAQAKKVGCQEYPQSVPSVLGVFYDAFSEGMEAVKFKKVALEGEILV